MPSKKDYIMCDSSNEYPLERRNSRDDIFLRKLFDKKLTLTKKRVDRLRVFKRMFNCDLLKAEHRISMVEAVLRRGNNGEV